MDKLSAFGRSVKLLTVRYLGLGLHSARFEMLTSRGIGSNATKIPGDSSAEEEEEEGFEAVHSECMNPITDAHWQVLTTHNMMSMGQPKFLISMSHTQTDIQTNGHTNMSQNFDIVPQWLSHTHHTACISNSQICTTGCQRTHTLLTSK